MQESNYDILGISEIASKKEIHEAFRRLALLHHADRGGNEEEFKKIKQSYDDIKQGKKYPDNNAEKKHKSHVYSTDDEEETRRRCYTACLQINTTDQIFYDMRDCGRRSFVRYVPLCHLDLVFDISDQICFPPLHFHLLRLSLFHFQFCIYVCVSR